MPVIKINNNKPSGTEIIVGNPQNVYFVIDAESLAHIGYHAFTCEKNTLRTTAGLLKGAFHGFFLMLKNQIERHSPVDLYFCWGDKRENLLRKQLYSGYKSHRNENTREGLDDQIEDIQLAISRLGWVQYTSDKGYEGDDVIASLVKSILEKKQNTIEDFKIVIISNDKDMLQLVNERVTVCTPSHSNYVEYTTEKVKEKFGITPDFLSDYLCLVGDSSDNVPGVAGIGPKTAVQLLNDNGRIRDWFANIRDITTSAYIKSVLIGNRENMVISKRLVTLNDFYDAPLDKLDFKGRENKLASLSSSPEPIFDKYEMTEIRPYNFLLF